MAETRHNRNRTFEKPSFATLLFADDQVVIAEAENNLQKAADKLNRLITECGLTASVQETKSVAFKGRDPVRTKIVTDNKIIEQVIII
jgi:transcription initiation factor TFIIIB Brf1 subunit/transcription initiation factor TFIIB